MLGGDTLRGSSYEESLATVKDLRHATSMKDKLSQSPVRFNLVSDFEPRGDQPRAIENLVNDYNRGVKEQTLLGVTGSGKTFTMAHTIQKLGLPTLVLAPNKTLAAQLYAEFKSFFPHNAVEYFVSYYDYYQPEAYIPRTDVYIEKDSSINDDIDKLRHSATHALLTRPDVIIVASVSCIYGLGSPEAYHSMLVDLKKGSQIKRADVIHKLLEIQYERNDIDFHRGTFRVRGDVLDVFPAYEDERAVRFEFFDDEIDTIRIIDALTGKILENSDRIAIYPNTHFVTPPDKKEEALRLIREELKERLAWYDSQGRVVEKMRLEQRTHYDIEMIEEIGYCKGIENYSRFFEGRPAGQPPPTLFQYFPKDFLLIIDESHITVSQVGAMYAGDRARKETLVDYGFRLPSALDNRPLKFEEFLNTIDRVLYVSATPGDYELKRTAHAIHEQVIRPTGLLDPMIEIFPVEGQVDHLIGEIKTVVARQERVLVTTLTKRMSENLSQYFADVGIRAKYLHSDIDAVERFQILRQLRQGDFDVLIGINLLREGLDLPEVSMVAILDGDKEGFLRSERSLIQTFGRAARHVQGRVLVYADRMTGSLQRAISETERRRALQMEYNQIHGITPQSVIKEIRDGLLGQSLLDTRAEKENQDKENSEKRLPEGLKLKDVPRLIAKLKAQMLAKASKYEFEEASKIRDQIKDLKELQIVFGGEKGDDTPN